MLCSTGYFDPKTPLGRSVVASSHLDTGQQAIGSLRITLAIILSPSLTTINSARELNSRRQDYSTRKKYPFRGLTEQTTYRKTNLANRRLLVNIRASTIVEGTIQHCTCTFLVVELPTSRWVLVFLGKSLGLVDELSRNIKR
jgi:hypothetical protein